MELSVAELSGSQVTDAGSIVVPDFPDENMHPHFTVAIDVTHHYVRKPIEGLLATAWAKLTGAEILPLAQGLQAQTLEPYTAAPYLVEFEQGMIDEQIYQRSIAKALEPIYTARGIRIQPLHAWGFNRIVADHIERAAMIRHSPLECWTAIRVPNGADGFDAWAKARYGEKRTLEEFLQFYFNLEA